MLGHAPRPLWGVVPLGGVAQNWACSFSRGEWPVWMCLLTGVAYDEGGVAYPQVWQEPPGSSGPPHPPRVPSESHQRPANTHQGPILTPSTQQGPASTQQGSILTPSTQQGPTSTQQGPILTQHSPVPALSLPSRPVLDAEPMSSDLDSFWP